MARRASTVLAAVALALAACSSAPTPTPIADPREILDRAVATVQAASSVHLAAKVSGTVNLDLAGTGSPTPLKLDGTTAEGDLDIKGGNAHLGFSAPALLGLEGDVISIGTDTYTRLSLLGPDYQKSSSGTGPFGAGGLGAIGDPAAAVADLQKTLQALPTPPTLGPDEACGDQRCYVVTAQVPASGLGGALGPLGAIPGAPIAPPSGAQGQGSVKIWVDQADLRPVRLLLTADGGPSGQITIDVALTNWDAPVTITAPPVDQVVPAPS